MIHIVSAIAISAIASTFSFAQTTAMDFEGVDCNGNNVHLFSDLDAGKAVILEFYMPNCGSCPPPAQQVQAMANNINATHPGLVKAYAFPFQNSTTCAYSNSWVMNNNLPLFAPMDSGAVQVAYYGGFGMPTIVLLGGANHDVLFVTQDYNTSDTTTMRDLILNTFTAGTPALGTANTALEVFPNPSSDVVHVRFTATANSESWVELLTLDGKQVAKLNQQPVQQGTIEQQLSVSGIPAGNYLVRVHLNGTSTTQPVQIAR